VCRDCARRAWLLGRLGLHLDFKARDLERLWPLLELGDGELIDALGGRARAELHAAHAVWRPEPASFPALEQPGTEGVCRHHCAYPARLSGVRLSPHALGVLGGTARLHALLRGKVVAVVGTRRATDYGMETARALARGLAASGVAVASVLGEGIPVAVHEGVLKARGGTLALIPGEVQRCSPAWCRSLHRQIAEHGCALAELVRDTRPRGWWQPGAARALALLADLVIVVEAGEQAWELACARVAHLRGIPVAAVPGRVSSPASLGTNALLADGALLVRDAQDALDALYGVGMRRVAPLDAAASTPAADAPTLLPALARVLERVGRGEDTLARLLAGGSQPGELALALTELELLGLLRRGDAGRYLPSAEASASRHIVRPQCPEASTRQSC
jgi:DNA processing protein